MQFNHWEYSPGLWPTLMTIILLPTFISLGMWQLDRAEQKQKQHDIFISELEKEAVLVNQFNRDNLQTQGWKKIKLIGQFHDRFMILLDNQSHVGTPGYHVFYPFNLSDTEQWILVNLGWVKGNLDRTQLPDLYEFEGELQLEGMLKKAPFTGIKLEETEAEKLSETVLRVQRIEYDQLSELLGVELQTRVIRLGSDSEIGYLRQWREPGSGKEKNIAYALQWFLFAFVLLAIHFSLNLKRKK